MSPSQVLQSLVCCLGDSVAGNPTQFVMSRAAQESGLDWRFFTSHVIPDDFEAAVRGIQALGLQGFAILEPYGEAAIPFLDTVTESGLALGKVTVGRSDGTSWLGDNLFGQAVLALVQRRVGMFGRHAEEQEIARRRILFVGSEPMAKCLAIAAQGLAVEIVQIPNSPEANLSELLPSESPISACGLLQEGRLSRGLAKQFLNLAWDENGIFLQLDKSIVDHTTDKLTAKQLGLSWLEPIDLQSQEAVCNFQFWTGVTPSWDVIKEALEEYLSY